MNNSKNGSSEKSAGLPTRAKDVAVYLDFENLYVSLKTTVKMDPNFDVLMEKCREFGRVTVARAYADWSEFTRMLTSQMFANGFEPIYVPTRKFYDAKTRGEARKNSVDIHITIDITKSLFQHENVDVYILISGDRDYVPLINQIRQRGKEVYAIGVAGCTSNELSVAVDEMLFYHQLLERDDSESTHEEVDVYNQLMRAIRIARQRGYPTTLGIIKPIMKELIEGFNEHNFRNSRGQPFQKFKDLVVEAGNRRMVRLVQSGVTTEVFLFGEEPAKILAEVRREPPARLGGSDRGGRGGRGERGGRGRGERGGERGRRPEAVLGAVAGEPVEGELPALPEVSTAVPVEEMDRPAGAYANPADETGELPPPDALVEAEARPATRPERQRGGRSPRARGAHAAASAASPGDPTLDAAPAEVEEAVPAPAEPPDDERVTGLKLDEPAWAVIRDAVVAFGSRPPSPRKLTSALKEMREAGRFTDISPTDGDLQDLVRQAVEQGRLERVRKGFSTIFRLTEAPATEA